MKTNKSNLVMILCTLIFSLSLFISCYLIALSNRYQSMNQGKFFFDSWKKEVIFVEKMFPDTKPKYRR
jgi:hypothetical protein